MDCARSLRLRASAGLRQPLKVLIATGLLLTCQSEVAGNANSETEEVCHLQASSRKSAEVSPDVDFSIRHIFEAIEGPEPPEPADLPQVEPMSVLTPPASPPRKFILHHIWKCGGTHLCDVARKSGFHVPRNPGCHRPTKDSPPDGSKWLPCAAVRGLDCLPFDVFGHECAASGMNLTQAQGFGWIGVIREPVEHSYSWLAHGVSGASDPKVKALRGMREWTETCPREKPCGFYTFFPNLQTRWLAGGKCLKHPELPGCIDKALARLKRMDVVLEQSGMHLLGQEKLTKFGWKVEEPPSKPLVSGGRSLMHNLTAEARSEDVKFTKKLVHLDLQLYHRAKAQGIV